MKKTFLYLFIILIPIFVSACDIKKDNNQNKEVLQTPISQIENNQGNTVPLPQGEDIVRTFFELINEKRIPEAISMMSQNAVPDDNARQEWGVQFNAFKSVKVSSIEKSDVENWTEYKRTYKVTLEVEMTPQSANAVIPYFGYDNKTNIRWIELIKNSENQWKINRISTGP